MLSDLDIIQRLLDEDLKRSIVISPMLFAPEQIGPSSVDVHLGTEFSVVERSDRERFDPLMLPEEYQEWLKHVRFTSRYSVLEPFVLHRGEFALASTLEFIGIPRDIVAHIDGRSSWARQGLKVHSTAGNIHPGSRGFVVFELENVGPVPILLYPGLAIAQLTFDRLDNYAIEDYAARPSSKYSSFAQNLFSAYPDDSTLRAMRQRKQEVQPQAWKTKVAEPSGCTTKQRDEAFDREDDLETLGSVVDSFQKLDPVDLRIAARPLLALCGEANGASSLDLRDSELRKLMLRQAQELHNGDPHSLQIMRTFLSALKRQRLRGD